MRRSVIACFERGALNLRGNGRLLLTLVLKAVISIAVTIATLIPLLSLLGLSEAYLAMLSGQPEALSEAVADWMIGWEVPAGFVWSLAILALGGLIHVLVQTFFDAGALGVLAAGDHQAPETAPADQPLTAEWFETFNWREFAGRGGQIIWRLLTWRLLVGFVLAAMSLLPFVALGLLVEGADGAVLVAGCFAGFLGLSLISLAWIWWWVVEIHMSWLTFGHAVRAGSRSFVRRGGSWMLLTGIAGLLLIAVLVPVVLLGSSMQVLAGSGTAAILAGQFVGGILQVVGLGAVFFLVWAAAIALARSESADVIESES